MGYAVSEIADIAVTPMALLAAVRESRMAADRAEAHLMELAVEWCHAHPASPGDESWQAPWASAAGDGGPDPDDLETEWSEDELTWFGIPPVAWHAPAAFAAANAMSTGAGKAFLRDALVLRHRLPKVWARVVSEQVQAWRARRIAQQVLGSPRDVVDHIDAHRRGRTQGRPAGPGPDPGRGDDPALLRATRDRPTRSPRRPPRHPR